MSTTAPRTATPRGVTKVSRAMGAAVEVSAMKDRVGKEARKDAERLLKATFSWRVPVEPVGIAQQLDIRVFESELDKDTLGGLFVNPEEDPKIVLNKRDGFLRRRMTCALEIGYFAYLSAEPQVYERVDLRSVRATSAREDPRDRYADEFAECLLMPEDEVRVMFELGLDDLDLALKFRVPREAAWSRLASLGLRVGGRRAA